MLQVEQQMRETMPGAVLGAWQSDGDAAIAGTALLDSRLRQVDMWSAQLVSGATVILPGNTHLDLAVVEDSVVKTSPDVVFHFALRRRF